MILAADLLNGGEVWWGEKTLGRLVGSCCCGGGGGTAAFGASFCPRCWGTRWWLLVFGGPGETGIEVMVYFCAGCINHERSVDLKWGITIVVGMHRASEIIHIWLRGGRKARGLPESQINIYI